jgi:gamma-aminobutyrate permease
MTDTLADPLQDFGVEPALAPENELGKSLKPRHVEMITIGGIIGAGLFVGSSASIVAVGPAAILSYFIAGALIMLVMRMLSEMAVAMPGIRSFPDFTRTGLGHWAGFVTGWLYWYFWVIVVAIEAIAGAVIIHGWLPMIPVWLIGVTLLALLTGVNLLSTRSYGEFEFWFSSLKVAAIIAFICMGFGYALGFNPSGQMTFSYLVDYGGFMPKGFSAVLTGVTTVIFALVGAEIATVAAAESPDPARTVARLTTNVAIRIMVFYVVSIGIAMTIVPWNENTPGVSPFTTALTRMAIPGAGTIMNVIVLTAVLSCLNSGLYVTSRVLFSLASHGDAPQALVKLNARKVPVRAILVASLFGYCSLAASIISPQVVFSFLANASGAIMLFVYMLIAVAHVAIRRRVEAVSPESMTVKMWFFPWLTYATILGMGLVLVVMATSPDHAAEFYSSVGAAAIAIFAFVALRRRSVLVSTPAIAAE